MVETFADAILESVAGLTCFLLQSFDFGRVFCIASADNLITRLYSLAVRGAVFLKLFRTEIVLSYGQSQLGCLRKLCRILAKPNQSTIERSTMQEKRR